MLTLRRLNEIGSLPRKIRLAFHTQESKSTLAKKKKTLAMR